MENVISKEYYFKQVGYYNLVLICFIAICFLAACATTPLSPPDLQPPVYGELYKPNSSGKFPAVVLLHGRSGVIKRYHDEAMFLSQNSYVALVLDYYKDIGSFYVLGEEKRLRRWKAHQQTVHSAVKYLKSLPVVNNQHIGLIGYSNGVMLALSIAGDISEIGAVVGYYGVSPAYKEFVDKVGMGKLSNITSENYLDTMPPLLILYGGQDKSAIIEESKKLHTQLREKGKEVQLQVYPFEGHGFSNEDARNRVIKFFNQYLK